MGIEGALSRHLAWDACYNVRDIGGYETDDGRQTRWRALVRADDLCRLTPAGVASLRDYGVRTIVDLRSAAEVPTAGHPFARRSAADGSLTYLNLPLLDDGNPAGLAAVNAAERTEDVYIGMLEHFRGPIAAIVRAVARAPDGTVLIHCHAGQDRTGLVVALLLALAGVPYPTIAADYALSSTYLQPLYEGWLSALATTEADRSAWWLASPPDAMLAVLATLDARHGGVHAYLRAAGVSPAELERIRDRLRA